MNLLFVTPAFPPFTGGGERFARSLALALAGCGHQVTVVTSNAVREQDFWQTPTIPAGSKWLARQEDGPLTVIRCGLRGLPGGRPALLAWRKGMVLLSALPGDQTTVLTRMARLVPPLTGLERALEFLPVPDLVVGFNLSWERAAAVAFDYAQQHGRPFVLIPFAHLGEGRQTRMARNNTMDHQRRLVAEADAVLALTEAEVRGFAAWGIRPEHFTVIGSGLDPMPQVGDPAALLEPYHLYSPYAIFIGRVSHDKGAIHAAEAVLALRRAGVPLTLALVGQPAPEFVRFYEQLDPAGREAIRPLGTVDEATKHALLGRVEMLLLPSRTDSFGIVLLEAWAHGKPVIGANVGGVGSVIAAEQDGLLVPFGDVPALVQAIQRLLAEPELAAELGRSGREKVAAEYTWERVAAKVLAVFTALVDGHGR